jgi:hypothetical protein
MERKNKSNGSRKKTPLARDNVKKKVNKKVKNATPMSYDGVDFKSRLEVTAYKTFKDAGFDIRYEPCKYVLWKGFKPTVPFYNRKKASKKSNVTGLKLDNKKLMDTTYTPDFQFRYKGYLIIIETKGLETNEFLIKKKLFRQYLENNVPNSIFFELFSKAHIQQALEIIKNL